MTSVWVKLISLERGDKRVHDRGHDPVFVAVVVWFDDPHPVVR